MSCGLVDFCTYNGGGKHIPLMNFESFRAPDSESDPD